jgi:bacteriocin biosynthesis cyclodehydratase domain-containing protein
MLEDRNLRFPAQPRLVEDLNIFQMPDGLGIQFRGAGTPVMLRGNEAAAAFAFLAERLDGTRTVEDLLIAGPSPQVSHASILRMLLLLHTKGLLAGGAPSGPAPGGRGDRDERPDPLGRQLLFWGRKLGRTGSGGSAAEVQRRLGASRLVLVGTGLFGAATFDLLARSGCRDIRVLGWDDDGLLADSLAGGPAPPRQFLRLPTTSPDDLAAHLRPWAGDADLLVTATRNAPAALFRSVNRVGLDSRCPWLCANEDAAKFDVGPYIRPWESACYVCLELRQASLQDFAIEEQLYQEHLAIPRPPGGGVPRGEAVVTATLAASLVALEAVKIITGVAAPALLNRALAVEPLSGAISANRILRVPRCPDCFPGALVYDEAGSHA